MSFFLVINKGKFKAALGIRSVTGNVFIEQYFTQYIEHYMVQKYATISREPITGIGYLCSNSDNFTISLFRITVVSLFCNGYEHIVFAGTDHVVKLIS